MNIICKNCHESYSIGSLMTRKLLLTYCTEKCAIEHGMSEIEVLRQFEERVPVPSQPQKPLDELAQLRSKYQRIRELMGALIEEEAIVKAIVESIYSHDIEADMNLDKGDMAGSASETQDSSRLINALEIWDINIEEKGEIVSVQRGTKHWLSFHTGEWAWMKSDGTWPWEHKQDIAEDWNGGFGEQAYQDSLM